MRYLGGKKQISKELAAIVNRYRGNRPFWDAFCGSLSVSVALGGQGLCSDIHPALISLYRAIAGGWVPPSKLSREDWARAKVLPDTDPLKAFAGFACSFRGLYFSGYAGGYVGPASREGALAASEVLLRDVSALVGRGCVFEQLDFIATTPTPGFLVYLDPPYRGTSGYAGTAALDYTRFYEQCLVWSKVCPVLVSEYNLPIGRCIWSKSRARKLIAGSGERALEKLYLVGDWSEN